jgi:hypothetical protein
LVDPDVTVGEDLAVGIRPLAGKLRGWVREQAERPGAEGALPSSHEKYTKPITTATAATQATSARTELSRRSPNVLLRG